MRRGIVVALVALLAAGCGASGPAAGPRTLTLALSEDPDALDPTMAGTFVSRMVFASMCEKLYDVDAQLHVVPQLATALPRLSDGGRTVTIPLRENVRFNDGTPFDAAAVKQTLDRDRTNKESSRAGELSPVTKVEVLDSHTVRLRMSAPFSPLASLLADRAGMIMSPKALDRLGDKFATDPVCVGPFRFSERVPGDRIVVDKSPYYYNRDRVKLDRIIYRIITEGPVRASNLRSGDVDVAERLEPVDVVSIKGDPSIRLLQTPSLGYEGITINVNNQDGLEKPLAPVDTPLGRSAQLREAFELALDREVINKVVFFDQFTPGCSSISPASTWRDPALKCPGRDLAKARELVRRSGVKQPVTVNLMLEASSQQERLGQVIQAMEKEAGFKVNVQAMEFTTALDRGDAGDFDAFITGWSGRLDPDGNLYNLLASKGPLNYGGQKDPEFDRLLDEGRQTDDAAARKQIYNKAVTLARNDRSNIVLYHDRYYTGMRQGVHGVEVRADGIPRVAFATVDPS
jgi:peptide/nickel transport system substrate-binding protein